MSPSALGKFVTAQDPIQDISMHSFIVCSVIFEKLWRGWCIDARVEGNFLFR